jgi:single-stranded DNA-specific DHH superfamily exonuclease
MYLQFNQITPYCLYMKKNKGENKMKKEKIDQAKKEVIKILTEDQPKGLNLSKEKIEELATSLVNNYLLKKENA